jgi:hypothetical protein
MRVERHGRHRRRQAQDQRSTGPGHGGLECFDGFVQDVDGSRDRTLDRQTPSVDAIDIRQVPKQPRHVASRPFDRPSTLPDAIPVGVQRIDRRQQGGGGDDR